MIAGDRQGQRFGALGVVVQATAAVLLYWLANRGAGGETAYLWQTGHLTAAATALAGLATLHAYLRRLAAVEEAEEAAVGSQRQLFDNELDGMGRRRQACQQFEKRLLPILAGALAVALAAGSILVIRGLLGSEVAAASDAPLVTAAAVLAVLAVVSFVVGKFVNAVAFGDGRATLRPVGGELLLTATLAAGAAAATLILHWEQPAIARTYAWLTALLGVLLGGERLALLIVDAYRPQQQAGPEIPVYESRLLGIFTQPEGAVRNLADIIRYQFGITLDEKVLGRFLRRVALPYAGAQALVLAILSTLVYVQPHETALVQGTSRAELEVLSPGLYWRMPWPLTRVTRVPSGRLQTVTIEPAALSAPIEDDAPTPTLALWTDERFERELFLAASAAGSEDLQGTAVNLAAAALDVRYRVVDPQAYFASHGEPEAMLRLVSRRELSRYLLANDLPTVMATGRDAMATALQIRIEQAAAERQLGIAIESVGVQALQPPPQVAAAWEGVIQARADAGRLLAEAEAYSVRQLAQAAGTASTLTSEARAATVRATEMAAAEAATFDKLRPVHAAYPDLLETRAAMDALEVWLQDARKVIIASDRDREVITLELKKARPDLLQGLDQ